MAARAPRRFGARLLEGEQRRCANCAWRVCVIRELDRSDELPPIFLVRRHPKDRTVERVRWPRHLLGDRDDRPTSHPDQHGAVFHREGLLLRIGNPAFRLMGGLGAGLWLLPWCLGAGGALDLEAARRKRIPTAWPCAGVCAGTPEGSPMPAATRKSTVTARARITPVLLAGAATSRARRFLHRDSPSSSAPRSI